MYSKLRYILSGRDLALAWLFLLLMGVGALLEVLGIGLIVPLVALLANPEVVAGKSWLRRAYDWSGASSPQRFSIGLLIAFVGVILVKNLYQGVLIFLQNQFIFSRQSRVSRRLFEGFLRAPYELHLQRHNADVVKNFATEVNSLFAGVLMPMLIVGAEGFLLVLLVLMLLYVMPGPALLVLCIGTLMVAYIYVLLHKALARSGSERADRSGSRLRAISEALGGLKEIKVFGREGHFLESFAVANGQYLEASRVFATLHAMPRLLIEALMLALLAAAALSVVLISSDIANSLPVVALLGVAALRLMPAATRILGAIASIRFYRPALDQVSRDLALLEGHSHPVNRLPAAKPFRSKTPSIELRGLRYTYPGRDMPALNGVSCVIPGGAVCGLVGPSGAGKSTIADLMLGLLAPQEGSVLAEGVDLAEATAQWRKRVGYVPQTIYLLDDSVRRNVAFGIPDEEIDDARVWSALRAAHMEAAVRSLPHGLDERMGERGARLSGGQRQRIGIARALYADPAMLVLDEATSALDLQTENAVAEAVLSLKGTRSVVVIAHRLETIRRCDLLFFLADGELQDTGLFADLLGRNARFAAFVGHAGAPKE